jgi:hypothetical protein
LSAGKSSDPALSAAAAQGIAGRSWTSATGSPVVMAVRLPLTNAPTISQPVVAAQTSGTGLSVWSVLGLLALGVILTFAVLFGFRRTQRNSIPKAVTP